MSQENGRTQGEHPTRERKEKKRSIMIGKAETRKKKKGRRISIVRKGGEGESGDKGKSGRRGKVRCLNGKGKILEGAVQGECSSHSVKREGDKKGVGFTKKKKKKKKGRNCLTTERHEEKDTT